MKWRQTKKENGNFGIFVWEMFATQYTESNRALNISFKLNLLSMCVKVDTLDWVFMILNRLEFIFNQRIFIIPSVCTQ